VCSRYQAVWSALPAFSKIHDEVKTMVDMINELNTSVQTNTKGSTESKRKLKEEMINQTLLVAGAAKAYAASVGNDAMVTEMTFSASSINGVKETDADDVCLSKIRQAQQLLQNLSDFGITQMHMDLAIAAVTNYTGMIGTTKSRRTEMKGTNAQMTELFILVNKKLKNEMDPLMRQFKMSNPSFHLEFFSARKVGKKQAKKKEQPE
jgi:hypothetical protein